MRQCDNLGVQSRVVHADSLHTHLLQLAVAAGLGALVAEEGAVVDQLDGELAAVQVVLNDGTHDARRALRPQGHRTAAPVGESVHFLRHDVGGFADTTGEQRGFFEDRQLHVLVACGVRGGGERILDRLELRRCWRHVVRHALRRAERLKLLGLVFLSLLGLLLLLLALSHK